MDFGEITKDKLMDIYRNQHYARKHYKIFKAKELSEYLEYYYQNRKNIEDNNISLYNMTPEQEQEYLNRKIDHYGEIEILGESSNRNELTIKGKGAKGPPAEIWFKCSGMTEPEIQELITLSERVKVLTKRIQELEKEIDKTCLEK